MTANGIRLAGADEYEAVKAFYYKLIDDMQEMEYHPKWQKGIYPSEEALKLALKNGEMYIFLDNGAVISAMRVNHSATEGYALGRWSIDAAEDEITVIHMLGVGLSAQGKGIAKDMVRFVIEKARRENQKAIRLDVLAGNIPAFRLYDSLGFEQVGDVELFYEDTGLTTFTLYEYIL